MDEDSRPQGAIAISFNTRELATRAISDPSDDGAFNAWRDAEGALEQAYEDVIDAILGGEADGAVITREGGSLTYSLSRSIKEPGMIQLTSFQNTPDGPLPLGDVQIDRVAQLDGQGYLMDEVSIQMIPAREAEEPCL